eukprot:6450215-Amphidinium_carterae.1
MSIRTTIKRKETLEAESPGIQIRSYLVPLSYFVSYRFGLFCGAGADSRLVELLELQKLTVASV